mmetsp:Transcript_8802/g.25320  ORF Transcript_8802/g.25320 Transcript_8802/m.25320 type:complete len:212 (-) Transcript_8802:1129-1764(-)
MFVYERVQRISRVVVQHELHILTAAPPRQHNAHGRRLATTIVRPSRHRQEGRLPREALEPPPQPLRQALVLHRHTRHLAGLTLRQQQPQLLSTHPNHLLCAFGYIVLGCRCCDRGVLDTRQQPPGSVLQHAVGAAGRDALECRAAHADDLVGRLADALQQLTDPRGSVPHLFGGVGRGRPHKQGVEEVAVGWEAEGHADAVPQATWATVGR